jgi:hypothetical protein
MQSSVRYKAIERSGRIDKFSYCVALLKRLHKHVFCDKWPQRLREGNVRGMPACQPEIGQLMETLCMILKQSSYHMVEIENAVPQMQVWVPYVQTSYRYATVQTHPSTSNFSHCERESFKAPKEQTVHNKIALPKSEYRFEQINQYQPIPVYMATSFSNNGAWRSISCTHAIIVVWSCYVHAQTMTPWCK